MSATTTERPRVDIGALAGTIFDRVAEAMAATVVSTMDWCGESGRPLSRGQKLELVKTAILTATNLEAEIAKDIIDDLERSGVETWGLNDDLAKLLGHV